MNGIRLQLRWILTLAVAGCTGTVLGHAPCCSQCGNGTGLRRVCRPVQTAKPVELTVWDAAEEDIAVPLASPLFRCDWGGSCCAGGKCQLCLTGSCRACCKVRPRNRLMRKTALQELPVVGWIVEYVCADCAAHATHARPSSAVGAPHFFGSETPRWTAEQELSTAHASDLAEDEWRGAPQSDSPGSTLGELFHTLQRSMLPDRAASQ